MERHQGAQRLDVLTYERRHVAVRDWQHRTESGELLRFEVSNDLGVVLDDWGVRYGVRIGALAHVMPAIAGDWYAERLRTACMSTLRHAQAVAVATAELAGWHSGADIEEMRAMYRSGPPGLLASQRALVKGWPLALQHVEAELAAIERREVG